MVMRVAPQTAEELELEDGLHEKPGGGGCHSKLLDGAAACSQRANVRS
jgi:hypothetical protein